MSTTTENKPVTVSSAKKERHAQAVSGQGEKHGGVSADAETYASSGEPIIVDLGKKKQKDVRKLRKGKPGKLLDRVQETLTHLRESGAITADAQPIIFVVRQRQGSGLGGTGKLWGMR